jgi:FAD/FMN-containing dehydrogenase
VSAIELVEKFASALGADAVLTGEAARERQPPNGRASVLVLPRSTEQVSRVLSWCHESGTVVVPQGGLTGLVEGARSEPEDVVLSLDRMRQIEEVDVVNRCMTVQAGVPLELAHQAAEARGLMLPLDLGARGTATVGGNVATNAGGTRVLRFGMMRDMVLGLEAVLADGTVIDCRNKVLKNNTGYDLKQLFIGSEGTLGVVTRVVVRLRQLPSSQNTALVALSEFGAVVQLLSHLEATLSGSLSSFEVMWQPYYELVTTPPARGQAALSREHAYYVLIETLGMQQEVDSDALLEALGRAESLGLVREAVVAQSASQRRSMWALRDDVEQMRRDGPTMSYDVSLSMEAYVTRVQAELKSSLKLDRCFVFGHLADGNLHVVVPVNADTPPAAVHEIVYGLLPRENSSVSAEHGIGWSRKPHLRRSRSEAEIALMRQLKRAMDPKGILNPHKIFD